MMREWKDYKLKDVVSVQRGYDLPADNRHPGDVPVIGSHGITGYHNVAKVKGPGVTIGRSGASIGFITYVPKDFWPHNATLFVTDFHSNNKKFVYYFLKCIDFKTFNSGSAQPSLNRNFIYEIPVTVPDVGTQKRIAYILSTYDDLIENNARRVAILEEIARRIYTEWFVHFRFPGHQKVKMVDSELGRIPSGWEVVASSQAIQYNPRIKVSKEGEKPFVPMAGLSINSMQITQIESRSGNSGAKFQNGDTLFARITPCLENGKTGYVNCLLNDKTVALGSTEFVVMRSDSLCPEYVYCLARSSDFRENAIKSMAGASGRQRVRPECFDSFMIAQPDPYTLALFQEVVSPMFIMIDCLTRKNNNLSKTRDLLIPKLISGEIDVSEVEIAA